MLKSTEGYSNIMKSQLIIPISNQTGPETGCPFTKHHKWFINDHHELHETKLTTVEIQEACHGI